MSSVLEINCLVFGDDPSHIFPIEIDKNESVGTLKNVIKERPLFDSVPADTLVLWNVSIPIDHLKDNVQEIDLVDETPLLPVKGLSEVFSKPPTRKHLHIVVKSPFFAQPTIQPKETKGEDIVAAVIARYNDTVAKARGMKTPSETAKSTEFKIYQQGLSKYDYYSRNPIETTGPPIQLFHPVFAYFLDDLANELTVPPEVFLRTVRYMQAASGLYDTQEDRWHAIEPPLRDILGGISRVYNSDGTSPNGLIQISLNGEYNHLRNNTCCPIFLLANAGSWFGVLGAVFTDKVIVQRLTDFIGVAVATVLNENHYERVAHVLYALRRNVDKLRGYYAGLELTPLSHNDVHPPFCPSIRAYRDHDKQVVEFRYLRPLGLDSTCATFLAKTLGDLPRFIVVKFVQCYGADAHRILAKENFAPQLLYYGKAGVRDGDPTYDPLHMVVMEYIDGMTLEETKKIGEAPSTLKEHLTCALSHLHKAGFVFGNLRPPNVMITKNQEVKLIGFDLAGTHMTSQYPLLLSPLLRWPTGVEGWSIMETKHDEDMLIHLFE